MKCIAYKRGYKYQIVAAYQCDIPIKPEHDIDTDYIKLSSSGRLKLERGYAWDGPSGPTIDTANFMRGSLVHDALYQLMREGHLDTKTYRKPADRLLRTMCKEDNMSGLRAWWVYQGVRLGGEPSADPANKKPIERAPTQCNQVDDGWVFDGDDG